MLTILRIASPVLFLLSILFALSTASETETIANGRTEFMDPVVGRDGRPVLIDGMNLCHLQLQRQFMFVPFDFETEGYSLAPNGCDHSKYIALSREQLSSYKALGLVPAEVPDTPVLRTDRKVIHFITWTYFISLLAFGLCEGMYRSFRIVKLTSTPDPVESLNAMTQILAMAAHQRGGTHHEAASTLAEIVGRICGQKIEPQTAEAMIAHASPRPTDDDLRAYGKSLTKQQKALAVTGAAIVAAGAGGLGTPARAYLERLGPALGLSASRTNALIAEAL